MAGEQPVCGHGVMAMLSGKEGAGKTQDEVSGFVEGRFMKGTGSAKADQVGIQVFRPRHI